MASATIVESCVVKALTLPGNLPTYLPPGGSSEQHRLKKCFGKGYVIVPRRVSPYLSLLITWFRLDFWGG